MCRRSSSLLAPAALVLAIASAPGAARGQGNDHSAPTGGRSALMGNTGIALARDGAGPFLNPATIVRIDDKNVAFSVNFYAFELDHFSNWHQPAPPDPRFGNIALDATAIGASHFHVLPSTLCLFFTVAGLAGDDTKQEEIPRGRRGRQKLAMCLGSLESQDVSLPALSFSSPTGSGITTQVQSVRRSWNRLHVGPTYSVQIADDIALGMSLHGVYSSDSFIVDSSSLTSVNGGAIQSALGSGGEGHSIDLVGLLGATYRLGRFTLGASFTLPAIHVTGAYQAMMHGQYSGADTSASMASGSGDFSVPPPVRVAFGVGAEWKRLTLEINETYLGPQADAIRTSMHVDASSLAGGVVTPSSSDAIYAIRSTAVWNTSAGAEYFVTPGFSLVGGVSTNFSSVPNLAPTLSLGNLAQQRMNRANVSFGIGSYGGSSEVLIGMQLGYGWGHALAVNPYALPNDWSVVDARSYSAMLVLAGATSFRTLKRAVERVEEVVSGDAPAENMAGKSAPRAPEEKREPASGAR